MPRQPKFPLPNCLEGKCLYEDYRHWLYGKAAAHVKRDLKRGNTTATTEAYRRAIHEAVSQGGDRDAFTGELLRWDLIRTYDNKESSEGKREYKKTFALLPTVDHLDDGMGVPSFTICGWRTNDCKGDLTLEELIRFCQTLLAHQRGRSTRERLTAFFADSIEISLHRGPPHPEVLASLVAVLFGSSDLQAARNAMVGLLNDGVAAGDVTEMHPVETLSDAVIGTFYRIMIDWANQDDYPIREQLERACDFLCDSIVVR